MCLGVNSDRLILDPVLSLLNYFLRRMNQGTQGTLFKSATTLELNPMVQLLEMKSVTHFRINLWKGTGPEIFIHQNPFAIGDGYFQKVLIIWHSQAVPGE